MAFTFQKGEIFMKIKLILFIFVISLLYGCSENSYEYSTTDDNIAFETETNETAENNNVNLKYYNKVSDFLENESRKTFSDYYELIDFEISNYNETIVGENTEALLNYKIIYKNYDKDPDTVGYIKSAKENNDPNYKTLYNEYLQKKDMNMEIKAVINKNDEILLYTDYDPTEKIEWVEFKMSDCISEK